MKAIYYPTKEDRVLNHPFLWTMGGTTLIGLGITMGYLMFQWSAG